MIAVDTNVLVRLLTRDNPQQAEHATKLISSGVEVFVAKTVLLETAWVLRSAYSFGILDIINALEGIGGMRNVVFEDAPSVALALRWVRENGLDFADALHLATAQGIGAQPFYSFDQPLVKRASRFSATEPDK
jgi:predicted nucleic-acid-binding protein